MKADKNGIEFLKSLEGLRLEPYQCTAGVWTIGYGHTWSVDEHTPKITPEQADEFLKDDLDFFEKNLTRLIRITITQSEFNALLSFAFNVGIERIRESTLLKKLNLGDIRGAAKELDKWVYAGGKISEGLKNRREKEKALLLADFESKVRSIG